MISYKKIIENLVEHEVTTEIEKKTGKFPSMVGSVKLSTDYKKLGFPTFEIEMEVPVNSVANHDYLISGFVSEYGHVIICHVSFSRTYQEEGSKPHKVDSFIHGDELKSFNYDR